MRGILWRCLLVTAVMAASAAQSKGMMSPGYGDLENSTEEFPCCDFRIRETEGIPLAENMSGVFLWNDMYCYIIPSSACSGGECEAVHMCCTDADNDGLYERCGVRRGESCLEGGEAVTAYCKH